MAWDSGKPVNHYTFNPTGRNIITTTASLFKAEKFYSLSLLT
jgi:hypothetical protein